MTTHTDTEALAADISADESDPASPADVGQPVEDADDADEARVRPAQTQCRTHRLALVAGLTMVLTLAALASWLGYRAYQSHKAVEQRAVFVQAGRQGALNLTTIDWQHADADIQRILSSATGTFYDDFAKRSQPFIDVLKQAQSKSEGTITEAGLETASGNEAQILVAASVKTSTAGAPQQNPRAWRMRISVQKVGDDVKMSNVEFVP